MILESENEKRVVRMWREQERKWGAAKGDRQWCVYRNEIEMKKSREWKERRTENEWICYAQRSRRRILALFYYLLLLNVYITHTQFIYVVLERYHTKNILPFTHNINANRFSFCNKKY
jgi:hypothetical protein